MLCDIHTHNTNPRIPSLIDISECVDFVYHPADPKSTETFPVYLSAGVHPCQIVDQAQGQLHNIDALARGGVIKAIGECGLDKFSKAGRGLQMEVLEKQIVMAARYNLPMVIHCVRLYSDFISVMQRLRYKGNVVMHSYNGNVETTRQLMRFSNVFFSFRGIAQTTGIKSIGIIPPDRILLETDTDPSTDLEAAVRYIADINCIEYNLLKQQIFSNFHLFLGV